MQKALHLLLVEDSASDAGLIARHIEQAGYELRWERVDHAEALIMAVDQQSWDVILCDYSMPDFSGDQALRIVQGRGCDAPFIFVSGTIGEDVAVTAMQAGAHDYVMKGNLKRLVPAIERERYEVKVRAQKRQLESARAQLVEELSKALAEVRRLSGLLAICSRCSRIRDDHGQWHEVENYIQEHSEAPFCHRLCPECLERIYADGGTQDLLRD